MPRPRKNDSSSILNPIIEQFVTDLAKTVEQFTLSRIERELKAQRGSGGGARGRASSRKGRAPTLCYFPGCKNTAAPRFSMFCAAEHKNLSKADKAKYRAAHDKAPGKRGLR